MVDSLRTILPVFFDLETTGTNVETDNIVQIAAVTADISKCLDDPVVSPRTVFSSYVNPGKPIPKGASDVHGILDDDVKWSPGQVTALKTFALLLRAYDTKYKVVLAGQNIERFDMPIIKRILPGAFDKYDTIDTYTAAIRMFPEKEHKLGPMYEHYTGFKEVNAHDAAADCHMCAHILGKMLHERGGTVMDFIQWLIDPVAMDIMPFGKYRGKKACEVPRSYFNWCQKNFTEPHKDFEATIIKCLGVDI